MDKGRLGRKPVAKISNSKKETYKKSSFCRPVKYCSEESEPMIDSQNESKKEIDIEFNHSSNNREEDKKKLEPNPLHQEDSIGPKVRAKIQTGRTPMSMSMKNCISQLQSRNNKIHPNESYISHILQLPSEPQKIFQRDDNPPFKRASAHIGVAYFIQFSKNKEEIMV